MKFLRAVALVCAAGLPNVAAAAARAPAPSPTAERPIRSIAIVINGEALLGEAAPKVIDGRVMVPLRAVFAAFGIPLVREGKDISATLVSGVATVTVGSKWARVDGRPIVLAQAPLDDNGTTFVPLHFIGDALGAVTSFDQKGAKIEIVSPFIGKNVNERSASGGGSTVVGSVSAIDSNSAPPALTVLVGGNPRTIALTSQARFYIEDTTIRSQIRGELSDVRVGDALRVVLTKDGHVAEVHDFFKSTTGRVAAVASSALVLASGRVIASDRVSEITINGDPAKIADIRLGDYVTVRSNPESGEIRQVIVTRQNEPTAAPAGDIAIASFTLTANRPLRAGESFDLEMRGTENGRATFDIGDYVTGSAMREVAPGIYRARFVIPERFNVVQVPVFGRLVVGTSQAPRLEADARLSAVTTPPAIVDIAPASGQTINNPRPSIYATFNSPGDVGIDAGSIVLTVNGRDVTASAVRSATFITYSPAEVLADGLVHVSVRVADPAGNSATRAWSFSINTTR
jgi:predicted regulator of Ras-like GTPase activity (Roadblock/LC7/MglB family)/uncharacterized Zn-binding protein involved in type VI secretion